MHLVIEFAHSVGNAYVEKGATEHTEKAFELQRGTLLLFDEEQVSVDAQIFCDERIVLTVETFTFREPIAGKTTTDDGSYFIDAASIRTQKTTGFPCGFRNIFTIVQS